MLSESVAIVAILVTFIAITILSGRRHYFILILPALSVPLAYLLLVFLYELLPISYTSHTMFAIVFVILGGLIGALLSFVFSHFLKGQVYRIRYTVFGIIVSIGLMVAYLVNL